MSENAIEIRDLTKIYGRDADGQAKQALNRLNLDVPSGRIFGLLGPNGAGKSTLINILAGLVIKTSGQVRIWGFDQDINPRQSRAAIGVMPQELNLDPYFTPRQALEVQAGLYGVPRSQRRSDEILAMVGLSDKANAYARSLSGGMRRRLLLGKALVHHPQILVLDEPTAGVDIELRQMLWSNIRRLNDAGMTIILTTHYLEEAEEMCDEIAIIDGGELIIQDSTHALLGRVDRKALVIIPETADIAFAPPADVEMTRREGDGALVLSYHRSRVSADQIFDALRAQDVRIRDVASMEADLEDVFLELTRKGRPAA